MERNRFETKTKFKNRIKNSKKRKEKKLNKYFFGILIFGIIHYLFIESKDIGSDIRYDLFVFWIPTCIGMLITIRFDFLQLNWKVTFEDLKKEKNIFFKIFTIPFLLVIHFTVAVIMFWMPSNIVWDTCNKMEAKNNKIEVREFQIAKFQLSRSSDSVGFYYNGKWESIPVSYKAIKPYLDKNPKDYTIRLELRKGIWNYYIVDSYDIL